MSISAIPEITPHWRAGLQAMSGEHSKAVTCSNPRLLNGSCDIDAAFLASQAQENRWDYGIEIRLDRTLCLALVEVHPASSTGNVSELCKKARWIDGMLNQNHINLPKRKWWINTGSVCSINSQAKRQLVQCGITGPVRTTEDLAKRQTFHLV